MNFIYHFYIYIYQNVLIFIWNPFLIPMLSIQRSFFFFAQSSLEKGSLVMHLPSRFHMKGSERQEPHLGDSVRELGSRPTYILISLVGGYLTRARVPDLISLLLSLVKSQHQPLFNHSSICIGFKSKDKRGSCSYSQQVGKTVTMHRDLGLGRK